MEDSCGAKRRCTSRRSTGRTTPGAPRNSVLLCGSGVQTIFSRGPLEDGGLLRGKEALHFQTLNRGARLPALPGTVCCCAGQEFRLFSLGVRWKMEDSCGAKRRCTSRRSTGRTTPGAPRNSVLLCGSGVQTIFSRGPLEDR